jgi:hypothetical protein
VCSSDLFSHSGESCHPELILSSLFQALHFKSGVLAQQITLLMFHFPPSINHSEKNTPVTMAPPTAANDIQIYVKGNDETKVHG